MNRYLLLLLLLAGTVFAQPFTMTPESASLCPCSTKAVELTLSNPANTKRTYSMSALGSAGAWATLTERTITLQPGELKNTFAYMTAPCSAQAGNQTLELKANYGTQSESQKIGIDVLECYRLTAEPSEQNITGCRGDLLTNNITITNKGKYREIILIDANTAAAWTDPFAATVEPEEKQSVFAYLNTTALEGKNYVSNLSIKSSRSPASTSATIGYNLIACYNLTLGMHEKIDACKGEEEPLQVETANFGIYNESANLLLFTEDNVLYNKTLLLKPNTGSIETIRITAPAKDWQTITTVLQTARAKAEKITEVRLLDCNAFSAVITPNFDSICPCQSGTSILTVTNLGKRQQNLSITTDGITKITQTITLEPYAKKEIELKIDVGCELKNPQSLKATVKSQKYTQELESEVQIPEFGSCYNTSIELTPGYLSIPRGKGEVLNVTIRNTGLVEQTFDLQPFGGEWLFLNPKNATLRPGDNTTLYLYLNPPATLNPDNYTLGIVAKSSRQLAGGYAKINVLPEVYAPSADEQVPKTLEPLTATNKTNASATPTGYAALGKKGMARTLAIVGILITIALILLISWKAKKEEPTELPATSSDELTTINLESREDAQKASESPESKRDAQNNPSSEGGAQKTPDFRENAQETPKIPESEDDQKTFFSHFTILARKITRKEPNTEKKKQDIRDA